MKLSTSQVEAVLGRKVVWAGSNYSYEEYSVGSYRTLRVRVAGGQFTDVMGNALSIAQIQAKTN